MTNGHVDRKKMEQRRTRGAVDLEGRSPGSGESWENICRKLSCLPLGNPHTPSFPPRLSHAQKTKPTELHFFSFSFPCDFTNTYTTVSVCCRARLKHFSQIPSVFPFCHRQDVWDWKRLANWISGRVSRERSQASCFLEGLLLGVQLTVHWGKSNKGPHEFRGDCLLPGSPPIWSGFTHKGTHTHKKKDKK